MTQSCGGLIQPQSCEELSPELEDRGDFKEGGENLDCLIHSKFWGSFCSQCSVSSLSLLGYPNSTKSRFPFIYFLMCFCAEDA